ncbi:DUF1648 domain-containing protein [Streptomyces sp. 2P-4]|uniref:DUF1648 domain-containing protein n=1 Tax=Streptomyces sp. 2P-4 TaxID=2931974 RepID=UPI00254021DA|nr:DUF1648 domain-containing protein [Streptomyces sp. 2P-4]
MTDRTKRDGARWGAAIWAAGVLAVLAALPLSANRRLPERLATHWGDGSPDGSMPLWAAALLPAALWAVLVLSLSFAGRRGGSPSGGWVGAALLSGGVFLAGTQASIVRANLDRADWKDAGPVDTGVVVTVAAAAAAGLLGWVAWRHAALPAAPGQPVGGAVMEIPAGERRVWLSRTSNPWLHLTAALTGLIAVAAAAAAAGGLLTGMQWAVITPFASASVLVLACSSVQARVTGAGLEVSFGPLGRPVRRWTAAEIVSARSEDRSPAQVGGWGYRLGGLGTTVMLRSGECLVIRPREGAEFAVSVDDSERGAALLNAYCAGRQADA